jgi:hypothetical protein
VRFLLDTHLAVTPGRIPTHIRALIEDSASEVLVSVVAIWEIAIKHPFGRLTRHLCLAIRQFGEFESADFKLLNAPLPTPPSSNAFQGCMLTRSTGSCWLRPSWKTCSS